MQKSSIDEIRQRFDNDVERFSNLETGQSATMDAPLVLDLITDAAAATNSNARDVLDIGCGAGNYTLKLLSKLPGLNCTLVDLSKPMLDRAAMRIAQTNAANAATNTANNAATNSAATITPLQSDIRDLDLGESKFDIILAAAVLHHLRDDADWHSAFAKFHRALRPGGSIWIADLVTHAIPSVQIMMWNRYGQYLTTLRDENYRNAVFAYVEKEDTPRPLTFQFDLLKSVGFRTTEILHKNSVFAAFGAIK